MNQSNIIKFFIIVVALVSVAVLGWLILFGKKSNIQEPAPPSIQKEKETTPITNMPEAIPAPIKQDETSKGFSDERKEQLRNIRL